MIWKARLPEVTDLGITMQLQDDEASFLPKSVKRIDWRIIQSLRHQGRRISPKSLRNLCFN
jgi:hypothetical protein